MKDLEESEEALEDLVEEGLIDEAKALKQLPEIARRSRRVGSKNIEEAYQQYVKKALDETAFYEALLGYIETVVQAHSPNSHVFSDLEDCVQTSALKIWRNIQKFDSRRGGFARFVTVIVLSEIRNHFEPRPGKHHTLEEAEALPSGGLGPERRLLFSDWLAHLDATDRALTRMLMDGLTQEEIGEALGISQSAVAQRLARIREQEKAPF